jgi:uncharacterized coiled-coil DUF342 family protein
MSNDIVARLRNKHADDLLVWEAADEIKRLRDERTARIDELVRNTYEFRETLTALRRDVETLTRERDEARREICTNEANDLAYDLERKGVFGITGKSMAEKRGWNCFTEDGK